MIRKMLRLPQGMAGLLVLMFGVVLAAGFDPASFPQENTLQAQTRKEAVAMYHRNQKNKEEKDMVLIMILGSLGFGAWMLLNAAWVASRPIPVEAKGDNLNQPIQPE